MLYILDLGGNVRKGQPGDSNVFGIQVGVSINVLVKSKVGGISNPDEVEGVSNPDLAFQILYNDETVNISKEQTFAFLEENQHVGNVIWQELIPDKRHTWLTELTFITDFDTFHSNGQVKSAKASRG